MRACCFALLSLLIASSAAARQAFILGPVRADPGTTVSGTIDIPARRGDDGTTLPVSVIHGSRPGPVLALVAGVHGQEYTPVLALQNLRAAIDPKTLAGTVVLARGQHAVVPGAHDLLLPRR